MEGGLGWCDGEDADCWREDAVEGAVKLGEVGDVSVDVCGLCVGVYAGVCSSGSVDRSALF